MENIKEGINHGIRVARGVHRTKKSFSLLVGDLLSGSRGGNLAWLGSDLL